MKREALHSNTSQGFSLPPSAGRVQTQGWTSPYLWRPFCLPQPPGGSSVGRRSQHQPHQTMANSGDWDIDPPMELAAEGAGWDLPREPHRGSHPQHMPRQFRQTLSGHFQSLCPLARPDSLIPISVYLPSQFLCRECPTSLTHPFTFLMTCFLKESCPIHTKKHTNRSQL